MHPTDQTGGNQPEQQGEQQQGSGDSAENNSVAEAFGEGADVTGQEIAGKIIQKPYPHDE